MLTACHHRAITVGKQWSARVHSGPPARDLNRGFVESEQVNEMPAAPFQGGNAEHVYDPTLPDQGKARRLPGAWGVPHSCHNGRSNPVVSGRVWSHRSAP